eukprot:189363-Karenia_brevis.AAC.1
MKSLIWTSELQSCQNYADEKQGLAAGSRILTILSNPGHPQAYINQSMRCRLTVWHPRRRT